MDTHGPRRTLGKMLTPHQPMGPQAGTPQSESEDRRKERGQSHVRATLAAPACQEHCRAGAVTAMSGGRMRKKSDCFAEKKAAMHLSWNQVPWELRCQYWLCTAQGQGGNSKGSSRVLLGGLRDSLLPSLFTPPLTVPMCSRTHILPVLRCVHTRVQSSHTPTP